MDHVEEIEKIDKRIEEIKAECAAIEADPRYEEPRKLLSERYQRIERSWRKINPDHKYWLMKKWSEARKRIHGLQVVALKPLWEEKRRLQVRKLELNWSMKQVQHIDAHLHQMSVA